MKKYDSYKDSGIEWIGEIPSHWEVKKVKHLTKLQGGYAFKSELFSSEGIPIIRIGDISDIINFDECKKVDDSVPKEYWIKQFDTLIALSGATTGKTCFLNNIPPKAYINQRVARIKFSNKLIYYIINSGFFQEQILLTASGSAQENISNSQIENLEISISNIPEEQTSIASFLDRKTSEIDEIIADKNRLLELYEEEKTAIINQAITKGLDPNAPMKDSGIEWLGEIPMHWEVRKLKYVILNKLKYGANESAEEENKDNPRYIRITDIGNNGKLIDETFKSLPLEKAEDYLLTEGDILFARSGATVGKTYHFKNYEGKACFAGYLIKASPNKDIVNSDFLYLFTKSGVYESWKGSIFNQATIQNIGADKYAYLDIPLPPLNEQQSIVHHIESECSKIDFKKARTEELIELLTEYRTALISEVVTGKIKVTED